MSTTFQMASDRWLVTGWGVVIFGGLLLMVSGFLVGTLLLFGGAALTVAGLALVISEKAHGSWSSRRSRPSEAWLEEDLTSSPPGESPGPSTEELEELPAPRPSPTPMVAYPSPRSSPSAVPAWSASSSGSIGSVAGISEAAAAAPRDVDPVVAPRPPQAPPSPPSRTGPSVPASLPVAAAPASLPPSGALPTLAEIEANSRVRAPSDRSTAAPTSPTADVAPPLAAPLPEPVPPSEGASSWELGPSLPFLAGAGRSGGQLAARETFMEAVPSKNDPSPLDLLEEMERLRTQLEEIAPPILVPGLSVLPPPVARDMTGFVTRVPEPPSGVGAPGVRSLCAGCGDPAGAGPLGQTRCWGCDRIVCATCFWRYGPGPGLHLCPSCYGGAAEPISGLGRSGARRSQRPPRPVRPDDREELAEGP